MILLTLLRWLIDSRGILSFDMVLLQWLLSTLSILVSDWSKLVMWAIIQTGNCLDRKVVPKDAYKTCFKITIQIENWSLDCGLSTSQPYQEELLHHYHVFYISKKLYLKLLLIHKSVINDITVGYKQEIF